MMGYQLTQATSETHLSSDSTPSIKNPKCKGFGGCSCKSLKSGARQLKYVFECDMQFCAFVFVRALGIIVMKERWRTVVTLSSCM